MYKQEITQNGFVVSVRKTDIVDVNDKVHNLPPDKGGFHHYCVADYFCPESWSKSGFFIPVEEGEPMWFDLRGNEECACIVSVQKVNSVTQEKTDIEVGLSNDPQQNYLKLPEQKWLDGPIGDGKVVQFVATKAGDGMALNEYVLDKEDQNSQAIAFVFYNPKNPKPKKEHIIHYLNKPHYEKIYNSTSYSEWYNQWGTSKYQTRGGSSSSKGLSSGISGTSICDFSGAAGAESSHASEPESFSSPSIQSEILRSYPQVDASSVDSILSSAEREVEFDKASMGQGGRINQKLFIDNNTSDYYNEKPDASIVVYMVLPDQFKHIMDQGLRQNSHKKDKYTYSTELGGIQVPLMAPKK